MPFSYLPFLPFSYPTQDQKTEMIKALLSRWPFLAKEMETYDDSLRLWRNRMVTFYKNHRFRCKLEIPEIIQKQSIYGKRKSDKESTGPTRKKINHAWGIPNFLPPLMEGEDEHSIAHHCETLKSQSALPQERRNKDIVHVLMVKTFADRRHMLVNEFKHLREIIEKYPLLCSKDQVRTHFNAFSKHGVRRDKPEKGVDVEMGGCHFFYYFTVQSHLFCLWEK